MKTSAPLSVPHGPPFAETSVAQHLCELPVFRSFQRAFEGSTGLFLALRRPGSFHFPLDGSRLVRPFFTLVAGLSPWCGRCLEFEDKLERETQEAARTVEFIGGIMETAVPILLEGELAGHLRTGQVCWSPPVKAGFAEIVRQWGRPADEATAAELREAYLEMPVVDPARYKAAVRLLGIFARQLSTLGSQLLVKASGQEAPAIRKVREHIEAHFAEEIHLEDAAHTANMSAYYFCKFFHRATGTTFTDYLARRRVEGVKEALRNPDTSVSEAAFAAGFQSLSQFNRVFLRKTGETPSHFRERAQSQADSTRRLADGRVQRRSDAKKCGSHR